MDQVATKASAAKHHDCFAACISTLTDDYSVRIAAQHWTSCMHVSDMHEFQVLEIVNDSVIRRLHEPRAVNQGEPKAPDTPQAESTKGPAIAPWHKERQQQPVAVEA